MTKRTVVDDDHSTAQTKEEHQSSPVKRWRRRKSSILATENNINDKKQVADDNEEMQEMEDEDFPQRAPRVRRMGPKPKINKNAESNVTTKSKKKRASSGNDDVDSKSSKKKRRKISHTSTPKTTPASTSDFSFITKSRYYSRKCITCINAYQIFTLGRNQCWKMKMNMCVTANFLNVVVMTA